MRLQLECLVPAAAELRGITIEINNDLKYVPSPLDVDGLKNWAESWSDRLIEQSVPVEQIEHNLHVIGSETEQRSILAQ